MADPYNLQRFVAAQNTVYKRVLQELRQGYKQSHWMWFVFPQIEGLGHSSMAQRYAITSKKEAEAYIQHPVLGPRLRECTELVTAIQGRSITEILGSPDDMKFRSSMTLFLHATSENKVFIDALEKYFAGKEDKLTVERL